ncbi:MAG: DUF4149 domain-containing protein [Acidobacteria bacterium]|nr:DUF4149 domain-containing protein [Acidobacteriota bacterium]MBV9147662.1 DUF4149 domain-containing protein [Acidobacteriota bacterium]MBV9437414.1 DUF4149 domain-containing protein [Acidobacteriota bacterium]
MRAVARFLLIFAMGVWLGSIVFFSFVVAPSLFTILPKKEMAGAVVSVDLADLHLIGLACGALFLVATFIRKPPSARATRVLAGIMLALTAISLFGIMPQMTRIRNAAGGSIEALPPADAGRAAFDRLHQLSVGLEGAVLLAGIANLALLSREP